MQFNLFIENFIIDLTQVCDKTFKKKSFNKSKKSNKWWTEELTLLRHQVNRAHTNAQTYDISNKSNREKRTT